MKKIIISCLAISFFSAAYADDRAYYVPQEIHNCQLESRNLACDPFDNTFLRLYHLRTANAGGEYIFDHAEAHPFVGDPRSYAINFYYVNKKNDSLKVMGIYKNSLAPDMSIAGNRWKGIPVVDPWLKGFKCEKNAIDCPFTRTPWSGEPYPFPDQKKADLKDKVKSRINESILSVRKLNRFSTLIINNETDFPITLRKSDYNNMDFQFVKTVVAAHSREVIIKDLPPYGEKKVVMFNLQIGNDPRRTTDNTSNVESGERFLSAAPYRDFFVNGKWIDMAALLNSTRGTYQIDVYYVQH